jgi:hypothetical protein
VNGKKPTQVTKSKVAENLFPVPCSLVMGLIKKKTGVRFLQVKVAKKYRGVGAAPSYLPLE